MAKRRKTSTRQRKVNACIASSNTPGRTYRTKAKYCRKHIK